MEFSHFHRTFMTESPVISNITNLMLQLTVFVCGALVMVYEIIGSRIVSPFIGTSTYVWGAWSGSFALR